MAIERLFAAISESSFISDGQANGTISINDTANYKVKMSVTLKSDTLPEATFQIKRVLSKTQMVLGPIDQPIHTRSDVSSYTTIDNARVESAEQKRPTIPLVDLQRSVYSEEPTVALRVLEVDQYGNSYSEKNPTPVQLSSYSDVDYGLTIVNNSATLLNVSGTNKTERRSITIQSKGKTIFYGFDSSLTSGNSGNGFKLQSNSFMTIDLAPGEDLYAITSNGTARVTVMEAK